MEEYVDHAVDSISITLNAILLAAALQLGDAPLLLSINLLFALCVFFAAHWAAQRTNSLVFGHFDVTEAQWIMILIHVISAHKGSTIWNTIFVEQPFITARHFLCIASSLTLTNSLLAHLKIAWNLKETPLETNGISIPRTSFTYRPLLLSIVILLGSFLCIQKELLIISPVSTMLVIGLTFGKAGATLILSRLLRFRKASNVDLTCFAPCGLFLLSWLYTNQREATENVAWAIAVVLIIDTICFHVCAMLDLRRIRDVCIFSVKPQSERPISKGFYVAGDNLQAVQHRWKQFQNDQKRKNPYT